MKYMIINADDFGYCPRRDQAIVELFVRNSISSASLLVNGDNALQACSLAEQVHLPMGLHLNLTEGRPITNELVHIRSLVDIHGVMHGKFGLRTRIDQNLIDEKHVMYEIEMQFHRYQQLTNGRLPMHIDGHQHIHVHPMLTEIIARLARTYHVRYVRAPADPMLSICYPTNPFFNEIVRQTRQATKIFDYYSLNYCHYFFGMTLMGNNMTLNNIESCLAYMSNSSEQNILAELMCHPGYPSDRSIGGCGTGSTDEFSQSIERRHEFDVLSSEDVKSLYERYNIRLCNYEQFFRMISINKGTLNDDAGDVDASPYE
jgi:predicted glycoside hydrolase/deacetylase ChbG (UPF0249 family)